MSKNLIILSLFISIAISACLKEEAPVSAPQPGQLLSKQIEIGFPYKYQVYYDCNTNKVVKMNTKYDWDISFESSEDGYHILLNTARAVYAYNTGQSSMSTLIDINNIKWNWDLENGDLDSTAIGDWRNKSNVYILNRQYDSSGNHLGYIKLKITHVDENGYDISFSDLSGDHIKEKHISKDKTRNFIHFSLEEGGTSMILEPHKDDWDLLFSNHYHKFSNLPYPFVLTQVLTNKENNIIVAESNDANFTDITLNDTMNYEFTRNWDEIGYDWKIRNSQDNSFAIDTDKSYILRSVSGYYFKIRFIDFYNNQGVKGYPKFEIQKL